MTNAFRAIRIPLIVFFAAFLIAIDAGVASQRALAQDGGIEWDACGAGWECGTVTVPLDYDDPGGETIDIAVSRLPAANEDERIGVLLTNPGGPGAGGVSYARAWVNGLDSAILDRFDIIGFDPRGTGDSVPVTCDEHLIDLFGVDQSPDTQEEFDTLFGLHEAYAAACKAEYGDLIPHLGTINVAQDMDAIRAALGEETISYVGYSYGTRLGSVYADLFPDRVRAMVLDGAVDNSVSTEGATLEQAAGFDLALNNFLEACRQSGCELTAFGDPADVVAEILARAEESPIPASPRDARPGEVILGIILPLYDETAWPVLERALVDAYEGDASMLVLFANTYLQVASTAVLYSVNCADAQAAANPVDTYAEYQEALPRFEEAAPVFGSSVVIDACDLWAPGADPIGVPDAEGAAPILVIGTTGDPATPYEWAEALADQLESAVLLTHVGEGHTVYASGGSACVDELVNEYLLELGVLPDGTSCAGDADPQFPSASQSPTAETPGASPSPGSTQGQASPTATLQAPGPPDTGDATDDDGIPFRGMLVLAGVFVIVAVVALAAIASQRRG